MKINNIDLVSSDGLVVVNCSFRDPKATKPYIAKEITGLDAEQITPRFYGLSQESPSKRYSLFLEGREIVLSLGLNPNFESNESYSDLRDNLYKAIASSRTGLIKLLFKNDSVVTAQVSGFVTKFESLLFSKSPEIKITITCDDPILKSVDPVSVDITSFGTLATITDSLSTATHGFEFSITFTSPASSFLIHDHVTPEWALTILFNFLTGDKLYFCSNYEKRFLYLKRGAFTTQLADKIRPNAVWPIIFPGSNVFHIETSSFVWAYLKHYLSYWGV